MKIGSHNTMSYLKPRKRWMRLLLPIARCQRSEAEAWSGEIVDIRLRPTKDWRWVLAHGICEFDMVFGNNDAVENWLRVMVHKYPNVKYIRLIMEAEKSNVVMEFEFARLCRHLQGVMLRRGVTMMGGRKKGGWELLYQFRCDPMIEQMVGSMQSTWGKVFPWLWTAVNRKRIAMRLGMIAETNEFVLLDFLK